MVEKSVPYSRQMGAEPSGHDVTALAHRALPNQEWVANAPSAFENNCRYLESLNNNHQQIHGSLLWVFPPSFV